MAQTRYPFINKLSNDENENEKQNRIQKIMAYYDNRDRYDAIISKHPEQRLATDRREVIQTPVYKKAARLAPVEAAAKPKAKKEEQLGLF